MRELPGVSWLDDSRESGAKPPHSKEPICPKKGTTYIFAGVMRKIGEPVVAHLSLPAAKNVRSTFFGETWAKWATFDHINMETRFRVRYSSML